MDRCSCFPLVVSDVEEVDPDHEFSFEAGYLILAEWIFDFVEPVFPEEALVSECALWIFGSRMKSR